MLGVAGASAYYIGGTVIYTATATRALLASHLAPPRGVRGATEAFASYLAHAATVAFGSTWGVGEGGAAGPSGNPYGDPPGHAWVAVHGPSASAGHVLTGSSDRRDNMHAFAVAALTLLRDQLTSGEG